MMPRRLTAEDLEALNNLVQYGLIEVVRIEDGEPFYRIASRFLNANGDCAQEQAGTNTTARVKMDADPDENESSQYNVYETLDKIHALSGNGHGDEQPTDMDLAEYRVLVNQLVHGTRELLQHLALHEILVAETAEEYIPIAPENISELPAAGEEDENDGFSENRVAIAVPNADNELLQDLSEAINPTTIEQAAELLILIHLQNKMDAADPDVDDRIYDRWESLAERVVDRVLPTLEQYLAAGILKIADRRTGKEYDLELLTNDGEGQITISIKTLPDAPPARAGTQAKPKAKRSPRK